MAVIFDSNDRVISVTGTKRQVIFLADFPQGLPGVSPVLSIGSVTTGSPGSPADATLTGTTANPLLNLTIPQGSPDTASQIRDKLETLSGMDRLAYSAIKNTPSYSTIAINVNSLLSYSLLQNLPTLFDGTWVSLTGKPNFAIVATSGSYTDLINRPALFSGNYTDLTNIPTIFPSTWDAVFGKPTFASVATSGSYLDLTNVPFTFPSTWNTVSGKPAFATVSTSGSYNDLSDRPTIPTVPSYSTIATNTNSLLSYTLLQNLPTLFSGNYNDLTNRPSLFDGTWNSLTGKPTFATVATSGLYSDLTGRPSVLSAFTNDPAYITLSSLTTANLTAPVLEIEQFSTISRRIYENGTYSLDPKVPRALTVTQLLTLQNEVPSGVSFTFSLLNNGTWITGVSNISGTASQLSSALTASNNNVVAVNNAFAYQISGLLPGQYIDLVFSFGHLER
jgi:hypothetical protein